MNEKIIILEYEESINRSNKLNEELLEISKNQNNYQVKIILLEIFILHQWLGKYVKNTTKNEEFEWRIENYWRKFQDFSRKIKHRKIKNTKIFWCKFGYHELLPINLTIKGNH